MNAHTPGPYKTSAVKNRDETHIDTNKRLIGSTYGMQHKENAQLFAAAPELLAALIRMNQLFAKADMTEIQGDVVDAALAAIAKAEGRLG